MKNKCNKLLSEIETIIQKLNEIHSDIIKLTSTDILVVKLHTDKYDILLKELELKKEQLNNNLKMLFKDEYIKFGIENGYLENDIL